MSHVRKRASKLATLDAARTIFFIVVGLAIRQSLALFSHEWPPSTIKDAPNWWNWFDRSLVAFGYIVTVLRYSHGVSQLYGYEKERVEKTTLPASSKIFWLSVFLALLGTLFYLMADNITQFGAFLGWTAAMVVIDFLYISYSQVVRNPFRRLGKWVVEWIVNVIKKIFKKKRIMWSETIPGYPAYAALQWMLGDVVLFSFCLLFLFVWNQTPHERLFALILIMATIVDYAVNREFYFGGKSDKRKQKIVFVCSPLTGNEPTPTEEYFRANIRRAQLHCKNLMEQENVIPFASHGFYTYFLNDSDPRDRILGRYCALAFLTACDSIYVYLPYTKQPIISFIGFIKVERPDLKKRSSGMEQEIIEASKLGLEIKYKREVIALPDNWEPIWHPLNFSETESTEEPNVAGVESRKRVYVCTQLRGSEFARLSSEQQKQRLQENIRAALWYCHELVRNDTDKEQVAPFAPQAFYPYFWKILGEGGNWEAWFERSLEILKVCDALYVYTTDGLPNKNYISGGMWRIIQLAESLGIEIQYRRSITVPENWNPALPEFGFPSVVAELPETQVRPEELITVPTMGVKTSLEKEPEPITESVEPHSPIIRGADEVEPLTKDENSGNSKQNDSEVIRETPMKVEED